MDPNRLISALRLLGPRGLRQALGALVPSRMGCAGVAFDLDGNFAHPENRLFCLSFVLSGIAQRCSGPRPSFAPLV